MAEVFQLFTQVLSSLKTYYKIFESYITSAYSGSFQTLLSKRKIADIIFKQQQVLVEQIS